MVRRLKIAEEPQQVSHLSVSLGGMLGGLFMIGNKSVESFMQVAC